MGRTFLVYRLAVRDLRHHAAQAVLLVIAIAAATATLTMALSMNGVTSQPYSATRAATDGPDVVAYLTSTGQAKTLVHASGVASSSGPYPVVAATIRFDGRTAGVFAQGRGQEPAAVDRPDVTAGSWVRPGGVVLERTFAEALGARVGDVVTLNGQRFTVAGIAVTAAQAPYPNLCYFTASSCPPWLIVPGGDLRNVGVIWMTEAGALGLTPKANPLTTTYLLNLKLSNPADADAFAQQRFVPPPQPSGPSGFQPPYLGPMYSTWDGVGSADALLVQDAQSVLEPGALLLTLLAIASVTVLVGRRLSEYARRVGLLKAVGGTPGTVAAMFLAENLVLALLAAAVGLVAGSLAAPLLTNPGAALVGAPGAPSLTAVTAVEVIGVALGVALLATLVPAIRAAHTSTVAAINDVGRPPRRRGALIRISAGLPVPVLFGLRLVGRRPRRALLSAANIAVTVTGIVAVLSFHATVNSRLATAASLTAGGLSDPVVGRDEQMLTVITIMLVVLAALNAIFTTWATVIDARRASALMRALGARAPQVSSGLVVAQVLAALPGAIVGIPLGIGLFHAAVKNGSLPPVPWIVGAVLGALLAMAALTVIPAWVGARQPVAEVLQAEAA
jgi:predicted lysophospholipase L1 biosynthesis ABC-type transport system permease subunit